MTQTRLPLFDTGIPQIVPFDAAFPVPSTELVVLDLRGDPTNQRSRLVTLWGNASSLDPEATDQQQVGVWIQQGSGTPVLMQAAALREGWAPIKILDNFLLRGEVKIFVTSNTTDLTTGDVPVVWGYYTLEGEAPRAAFELRALQPDPNVIPATMGQPVGIFTEPASVPPDAVPTPIDTVIHTVSDTNIDEIRLEAFVLILSDPNLIRALLYFEGTSLTPPLALGTGYISLTSPLTSPVLPTTSQSAVRRYFDSIPFIRAGELRLFYEVIPVSTVNPDPPPDDLDVYAPTIFSLMGSFLRN